MAKSKTMPNGNDIDIAGLREMEGEATKCPWWIETCKVHNVPLLKYRWDDVPTWIAEGSDREKTKHDFAFLAALRNAAPQLLALAEIGLAAESMLPKSRDGQLIFPGQKVYQICGSDGAVHEFDVDSYLIARRKFNDFDSQDCTRCFSTREAAEAYLARKDG